MKSSVGVLFALALSLAPFSSAIPAPADAQITPPPGYIKPCYTHTTTFDQTTCPVTTCIVMPCISITTSTTPCLTLSCSETPTITRFRPCPTTCRTGCYTSTSYVTPPICPL
ncbi:predicted protein [Histoplasma capsulatum G186AR]|uniref:Uncharacterized protein n=3 Tax=Ajellomyces capsulatus TaxID=5037 RepID=C0NPF3_AJECG|nr:uncharacterized protein HCBG_05033 [Histoplasma capsulatum G186AR]EEH06813.1 predicted protein [Histoplasma capsulatum G186AR]KAG5294160.1 hypothetical protein I7I52_05710 [Histoplasma capsulatum]QSS53792.1 hypothetical protein I7I53_01160 [Histoplasma capsulatum var. duboisii H88]QSS75615.1 hypothetical protein I7I50_04802 [Histoplasma capsulatum G186AR]